MRYMKTIFPVLLLLALMSSCNEDKLSPVENDGIAPAPISNPQAEALPGAVKITYTIPSDKDLLYIKAEFTNKGGQIIEVKASYYTNSLKLEGFADTSVYQVKLYAVDKGENKSQPVTIDVKPLRPPVYMAKDLLTYRPDFGGINIKSLNTAEADLAFVICIKDSLGDYKIVDTYYSKRDSINFSIRGFDSIQTNFAIYVRDRWNNRSDTVFASLTPIYEKLLDKTKFSNYPLTSDAPYGWGLQMPGMWDGKITAEGNMWHSADPWHVPMWITFDLGVAAKLSRFTLWQRQGTWIYTHGNPKDYEVWGSSTPPSDSWSWPGWVLLSKCTSVKPSGNPLGSNTSEDIAAAAAGESWNVSLDAPAIRYIRIKINSTWAGGVAAHISEISFWGNDKINN
jgi:hypothetical protein